MYEHQICLVDKNGPPPQCQVYPLEETILAELKKQLALWLEFNHIELSISPYSAPVLFV